MMNLLPIDHLRYIISYHPWHFWQLSDTTYTPIRADCDDIVYEYAWQSADRLGRDEVRRAIETAEQLIRNYLHYWPAPRYLSETITWPTTHQPGFYGSYLTDPMGRYLPLKLPDHYVQAAGTEQLTLIGDADVLFSDEDGDGLAETFTATIATTVTDADQVVAYFTNADRLTDDMDRWRIEPVQVAISGGVATITGRKWLLVKPIRYEGVQRTPINPTVDSNFVSEIAVYQRTTNTDEQATLVWEAVPFPSWASCEPVGTDPAAIATAPARVGIRDGPAGVVGVGQARKTDGTWTGTGWWEQCNRPPDRVVINYLAGYPFTSREMDRTWQRTVTYLAIAQTVRELCGCRGAGQQWRYLQQDLARTSGDAGEAFGAISAADLSNPFGTRRGAVLAWKHVNQQRLPGGYAI
jgi:hypothetical protein